MKTKNKITALRQSLVALFLMMSSVMAYSQVCPGNSVTLRITNPTIGANYVEFDVEVRNSSATNTMRLASVQGSFTQSGIPGTISAAWTTLPTAAGFEGHQAPSAITLIGANYRWTNNPAPAVGVAKALPTTFTKFGTIRVTSTANLTAGSNVTITLTGTSPLNNVGTFCNAGVAFNTNSAAHVTVPNGTQGPLTLGAALVIPIPSACPTAQLTTQTPVTCFGGADGTASITLTGTATSASYSVDGGTAVSAPLVGNVLTVTGLTAGAHSIVVNTMPGTCTLTAIPVTITGPSEALTNTTNQTSCDSFAWGVTGQTYSTSGTYTGTTTNGNGCTVQEILNLTINESTSSTETVTACDTFTWAANNQAYTASGTYIVNGTNGAGCADTKTLVLTINNSTSSTENVTACDSYTWAANNQLYTASGTYVITGTNAAGCVDTQTLVLTINNSSTTSETITACDTYTWGVNGSVYTTSGTYTANNTNASGCPNVATLILTINSSSTSTETETACGSFTWAANGQTYNTSGTYTATTTNAAGCPNAATLILTINAASVAYYADTDNDGFGAGAAIFSCTGQPAGTVLNNTDCAPNDPLTWRTGNFYIDADNDGYYNGNSETTPVCYGAAIPSGYVATIVGTDCLDSNGEVNPNHVEVAANGIDDNCDGAIDEAGPMITLIPSQCNNPAPLSNIANTIYATQPAGAQGYRFEVTNGSNVRTYDSLTNSFSLLNLAGGATYATTYSIRVAVKIGGFWRTYAGACTVTTPAQPATTNVIASQCGATLANIANLIYANQVTAANQYRFIVTNTTTMVTSPPIETSVNRFSLTSIAGGAAYGTTYSIAVALRFGTTWQDPGTACNVTTPATPGLTKLITSQCGLTNLTNGWTTLYANQVPDAQGYRFEVFDGTTTRFYPTSVSRFALRNVAGMPILPNNTYTIRVQVLYNNVYGGFGDACTVTTGASVSRQMAPSEAPFTVKSYPNPFADTFKIAVTTTSQDVVALKVYDMVGKLVESREVSVSELGTQEVGSRYSSGVYNVIVTQGENVQTLRVIKR